MVNIFILEMNIKQEFYKRPCGTIRSKKLMAEMR